MNTETKTETYEQFESRRRQEIQDEAIAKAESNKILNKARINARHARFGIHAQLPRSHDQLAIVAAEETRVLGAHVEAPLNIIKEATKNDAGASLPEAISKSIDVENQAKNNENSAEIDQITLVSEKVDCRDYFDIAKPFIDDGTQLEGKVPSIEQALHDHFDLVGHNSENGAQLDGAHLSCTEILLQCGAQPSKANVNTVSSLLKSLGFVSCKSKGKRGYRVTARVL